MDWSLSAPGLCFSSVTIDWDRVSVQTMALCRGSPVSWSQTTVVSRWLVMPAHWMLSREWPLFSKSRTASSMQVSTEVTSSRGSCSCQLGVCVWVSSYCIEVMGLRDAVLVGSTYPGLG